MTSVTIKRNIPSYSEFLIIEAMMNPLRIKVARVAAPLGSGLMLVSLALYLSPLALPFAASVTLIALSATSAHVALVSFAILVDKRRLLKTCPFPDFFAKKQAIVSLLKAHPPLDKKEGAEKIFEAEFEACSKFKEKSKSLNDRLRNALYHRDMSALIFLLFMSSESLNDSKGMPCLSFVALFTQPPEGLKAKESKQREILLFQALLELKIDNAKASVSDIGWLYQHGPERENQTIKNFEPNKNLLEQLLTLQTFAHLKPFLKNKQQEST